MVVPSRMEVAVTPTSLLTTALLLEPAPHAARVTRQAASAASRDPVRLIETPPISDKVVSSSLRIWRHLSSPSIAGTAQPPPQPGVSGVDQAHDPIAREDHDQDQKSPVGDRGAGPDEDRRHLRRKPRLARDELAGLDREPESEDAAQERPRYRRQASDDRSDQQLQRE